MKTRSLVELMMGHNLFCKRMKIFTTSITYNSLYVTSRKYHKATNIPSHTSFKSSTVSYRKSPTCPHFSENRKQLFEEHKVIRKGDVINLRDLLFTEYRDYVVRYEDNIEVQVKSVQLAGKVIVLYFLPLHHDYLYSRMSISYLTDTYTYLLPDNVFEVVVVPYGSAEDMLLSDLYERNQSNFESIFHHMPWTAIPFPDITSRERLLGRFGIDRLKCYGTSVVIDSSGMVLQSKSCNLFKKYGGLGYPFSDKRIKFLKAQDDATARKPSLKALLGSPKRDFVITNKRKKVLIDTLEEKVVALYFYEEGITPNWLTTNIKMAYEELAQTESCFEVVLIYLHCTMGTIDYTSDKSFWNTFETMPWLALPFKDPKCERLMRFFRYPYDRDPLVEAPALAMIGPHGKFIEPFGAEIIGKFKLPTYPFTRNRVAKLDTEIVRELKLDMLWDRSTIFRAKDGSKVQFSQLVGKRIILFFEGVDCRESRANKFLKKLKERYLNMKGTSDEFEVIYITNCKQESLYNKNIKDVPSWFISSASELLPIDLHPYCCYCHMLSVPNVSVCGCSGFLEWRPSSSMLAFDRDGQVVRKSRSLSFTDMDFPFHASTMENQAYYELSYFYNWNKSKNEPILRA